MNSRKEARRRRRGGEDWTLRRWQNAGNGFIYTFIHKCVRMRSKEKVVKWRKWDERKKRRRRKCYSYTTERINAIFLILVVSSRNSFSSSGRRRRRERIYIYMRHLVFRGGSSDFYDQRAGGWPVNGRPVTAQLSVPFSFFSLSLCAFDPSFIPSLGFSFFPFPCMTAHESLYNTVRKCRSDGINFDEFPNKKKISKKK